MLNLSLNLIKKIKRSIFPFYKNRELKFIFKTMQEGTLSERVVAMFVGGCVRKYLSGEKIDDIDVATILTTDQIKEKFKKTNYKVVDTGIKHGTVTILTKNFKVEITTLRKDIKTDGRHAEIEYTDDWKKDSERRDFTVNAIYLDIKGNIFDPQMGTVDLKNKNIKFIGDPQKRIEEDYLRIIRFIRFKIMYDLSVEMTISNVIKENLDGIKKISKERILLELLKILEIKNFLDINRNFHLKEIFQMIFPEFLYLDRLSRLKKVYNYSEINKNILLSILLIDEKDNHEYFEHKYNISNEIKEFLKKISKNLDMIEKDKNFLNKDLIKNTYIYGKKHLIALNLVNFSINPKIKQEEFSYTLKKILKLSIPNFHVNGEYLKRMGMEEGETLGKVLKIIEDEWINNNFQISDDKIKEFIRSYKN